MGVPGLRRLVEIEAGNCKSTWRLLSVTAFRVQKHPKARTFQKISHGHRIVPKFRKSTSKIYYLFPGNVFYIREGFAHAARTPVFSNAHA